MKSLVVLVSVIGIGLLLIGCGESNENAVLRSEDMITVYWVLEDNEEINNFELSNNILKLDVKTGELHEQRSLPIKFAASHENLEIKGMSRLDELAIFHIVVNPMMPSHPELPIVRQTYTTYRGREHIIDLDNEPGDFTKAKTFRSGDRITMFWHRPNKPEKKWHKWTQGTGKSDMWMEGRPLPDNWTEDLSITGVEPHESVKVIGIGNTPEIFIVYFRVLPKSTE